MDFSKLRDFMDHLTNGMVPGNAAEVYFGGKRVFRYASGFSSVEEKKPMTGDEYLNIYSCSKITTVTAAMQLFERGKFLMSDRLSDYMPEYRDMAVRMPDGSIENAKNPIRMQDLFCMTAGFSYDLRQQAIKNAYDLTNGRMDTVTVCRSLAEAPLCFEPGTRWQYSLCHDVLAGVVEVISGKRFRDYVTEHIFQPLGMEHAVYHHTPQIRAAMAEQYAFVPQGQGEDFDQVKAQSCATLSDGVLRNVGKNVSFTLGPEYDSGGAGITTTVGDYALLCAALAGGGVGVNGERILSRHTIDLMRTNCLSEELRHDFCWSQLKGYGYGFGVRTMIDKAEGGSNGSLGEFGWGGAAGASALIDPAIGLAVFYAHHMLNPREDYYQPRLRNVVYSCLD